MTQHKTFADLNFKPDPFRAGKHAATIDINGYTVSVIYGDSCYGDGPTHDTYEFALFQDGHDAPVPLQGDNDDTVLGWVNHEEITVLMKIVQQEPEFGTACRVFKRTRYNHRFSNMSQLKTTA
jgi:hypothetical protein